MPLEYTVSRAVHARGLCEAIAAQFNQQSGGWTIGHKVNREAGTVTLMLPEGLTTVESLDVLVASLPVTAPQPQQPYTAQELQAMIAGASTLAELRSVLVLMARALGGRVPRTP